MPGRPHHTEKMKRCVDEVMAKGHTESSAYAICTTSLKEAGEEVFEAAAARHIHLVGAAGRCRIETLDGREHLVVPVVALMEGVIHAVNADTPEFVPADTLRRAAASFNGRPVVVGHPTRNGKQCSANDPRVLEERGVGTVFNARFEGKKLLCEAWVDRAKAERVNRAMVDRLLNSEHEEVSVGAFVVTDPTAGVHGSKAYKARWASTEGDHLALLPGGRGACSGEMGCGAHRSAEAYEVVGEELRALAFDPDQSLGEDGKWRMSLKKLAVYVASSLRAAAGRRNSAADQAVIQSAHDNLVTLGAECDRQNVRWMARKNMIDCAACEGSGSKGGNPCEVCDGNGYVVRAAEEIRAACGCEEGDVTKTERIAALLKHEHNPLKDQKALEAASEESLKALEMHCVKVAATTETEEEKKRHEEEEKASKDAVKAAESRAAEAEAKLKTLSEMTEAQALDRFPSLRALVDEKRADDDAQKTTLVTAIRAATQAYAEDELKAMAIPALRKLAEVARVPAPAPVLDFSGRGVPRQAAEGGYKPPDTYAPGIKALQEQHKAG